MTRLTLRIFGPVLIWALHFAGIYAMISAACAPRAVMDADTLVAVAAIATGAGAIGCLVFLMTAGRARRRADDATRAEAVPLSQAAWWSALISLLAVLANAWPVATLSGCTG